MKISAHVLLAEMLSQDSGFFPGNTVQFLHREGWKEVGTRGMP